jgi:hypothetical protein
VGVNLTGLELFDEVNAQVAEIHRQKRLASPDRFDIAPPTLDEKI